MLASDDTLGLQGGNVNAHPHFFCILHFAQILQDHPMNCFFFRSDIFAEMAKSENLGN